MLLPCALPDDAVALLATAALTPPHLGSGVPGFPSQAGTELAASSAADFSVSASLHIHLTQTSPVTFLSIHSLACGPSAVFLFFLFFFLSLVWFTFQCLEIVTYDCIVIPYFQVIHKRSSMRLARASTSRNFPC